MNNINIKNLIKDSEIKKGSQNIKVPIDKVNGEKYNGQTYMIPLKYLYYNDQNGRIGTAISKFEAENGQLDIDDEQKYNKAIEDIIIEEDSKKMNELKRDIANKGQNIPGYVLNDGRVIDGNRRFTACRMLDEDKEVDRPSVFEAVLIDDLDADRFDDKSLLKQLELRIQFGLLGREDYDPIDKAIDAYKAITVDHLMTAKNYAEYANLKKSEVKKRLSEAELIVEFLKFINADESNYSIAKQLMLDGPLEDLVPQYNKYIRDNPQKESILGAIFAKLIQLREKSDDRDFKEEFRTIVKKVIGQKSQDNFVTDLSSVSDEVADSLGEDKTKDANDLFAKIDQSDAAKQALVKTQEISEEYAQKALDGESKGKPEKLIIAAKNKINNVDQTVFNTLSEVQKQQLVTLLDEMSENISSMKDNLRG